jgi:hypothetical protein
MRLRARIGGAGELERGSHPIGGSTQPEQAGRDRVRQAWDTLWGSRRHSRHPCLQSWSLARRPAGRVRGRFDRDVGE